MIVRNDKPKGAKKISKADFARQIGITPQNLNYHLKAGKAPPVGDVDAWMAFLAGQGRDASLPKKLREQIAHERLRLIKENVRKAKMENDAKRHELIEFAIVSKFIRYLVADLFFGELDRLAHEFPATMKGKDEMGIFETCQKQIARVKQTLAEQIQNWEEKKGAA